MKMKTAPKSEPSTILYCTPGCERKDVPRYKARPDDVLAICVGCKFPGYVSKEKELDYQAISPNQNARLKKYG